MGSSDLDGVRRESRAWIEANWSVDLTLREWWRRLAESGWGFPSWPERWFGRSLDRAATAVVDSELERAGALAPPASGGQRLAAPTILQHGTDEQRDRLLGPLARGEEAWCQLFSEPDAGSDLASLRTRAIRDGNGWRINGQKIWTSGAQASDRAFLLARTGRQAERHRGLTYFVVDLDQAGVTVRPLRQMTGESAFNQVFLDEVFVGDDDVIGAVGDGWSAALTTLGMERFAARSSSTRGFHWSLSPLGVPGRHSSTLDAAITDLIAAANRTMAPRADLEDTINDLLTVAARTDQLSDSHVSDLLVELYLRNSVLRQARAAAAGAGAGAPNGSVRKLMRSRTAEAARDGAVALLASTRFDESNARSASVLEAIILSSPAAAIAGGTDEIQLNVIAERVLGLPRERRIEQEG